MERGCALTNWNMPPPQQEPAALPASVCTMFAAGKDTPSPPSTYRFAAVIGALDSCETPMVLDPFATKERLATLDELNDIGLLICIFPDDILSNPVDRLF